MSNLLFFLFVAALTFPTLSAQQSPFPNPAASTSSSVAPCPATLAPKPLAGIKINNNSRWKQMFDRKMAEIGKQTGIDLSSVDVSKLSPHLAATTPCSASSKTASATQIPPTPTTNSLFNTMQKTISCFPSITAFDDPESVLAPSNKAEPEFESVQHTFGAPIFCASVHRDPVTNRYWVDPKPALTKDVPWLQPDTK